VKDVDLAFFDASDLTPERDTEVEVALHRRLPTVPWEATWPETATSVAVRLDANNDLQVTAPCGLDDLLNGVCRRNPRRVSVDEYHRRLEAKQVLTRWPRNRRRDLTSNRAFVAAELTG